MLLPLAPSLRCRTTHALSLVRVLSSSSSSSSPQPHLSSFPILLPAGTSTLSDPSAPRTHEPPPDSPTLSLHDEQLLFEASQRNRAFDRYRDSLLRATVSPTAEFESPYSTTNSPRAYTLMLDEWAAQLSRALSEPEPSSSKPHRDLTLLKQHLPLDTCAGVVVEVLAQVLSSMPEAVPVVVLAQKLGLALLPLEDDLASERAITLGSALLQRAVESLTVKGGEPALVHAYQVDSHTRKRQGVLLPHEHVSRLVALSYSDRTAQVALKGSEYAPMVVPPKVRGGGAGGTPTDSRAGTPLRKGAHPALTQLQSWASGNGGFLSHMIRGWGLVGRPGPLQVQALARVDTLQVRRGVDSLAKVPWTVNQRALALLEEVHEAKVKFGKMPPETLPALVQQRSRVRAQAKRDDGEPGLSELERRARTRAVRQETDDKLRGIQSKLSRKLGLELVLAQADALRNKPCFYYPYNMDFRGRVYPLATALNHTGEDTARGLLSLARPRPLGPRGLFWLKVHLANQLGQDKAPLEARARWVDERMDQVRAVLRDPPVSPHDGTSRLWNTDTSKPLQAYAACVEIALADQSGNPATFASSLPVHQDGSCNGLQHYAALGRDLEGGRKVNLVPQDGPADVYAAIATIVRQSVQQDAEQYKGELDEQLDSGADLSRLKKDSLHRFLATLVLPHVSGKQSRKIVKQTVMTSVYGVTHVGAKDQIQRQLEAINEDALSLAQRGGPLVGHIETRFLGPCANYLAKVTMKTIGDEFVSAKAIMGWLKDLCTVAARHGQPMTWITPMGLPIAQPYQEDGPKLLRTAMQNLVVATGEASAKVNAAKQRSAIAPNFVHSLDSTHMLMTSLTCQGRGIDFAAVHDSFWTHAGSVDALNNILRQDFVNLHEQDILGDLHFQIKARFPQSKVPPPPPRGNLDLKGVLQSQYFFN